MESNLSNNRQKENNNGQYYTRKKQVDCEDVFSDCNNNESGEKMITKTDIGTNGTHYCKIRTESFSYEGQIVSIRTSDKGGYKKDGTKASGCTSQLSAESSALNSLINKISDSLNLRNSVSGEWIILKQWLIQNPDRYEQLQTEIRKHIAWAEFENGYSRNGIISHTAMNGALKAVFA